MGYGDPPSEISSILKTRGYGITVGGLNDTYGRVSDAPTLGGMVRVLGSGP